MEKVFVLEERAWHDPRLKKLAAGFKGVTPYAIGVLVALWHNGRKDGRTTCSKRDIDTWFAEEISNKYDIFSMLQESGYLEKVGDDEYKIHGN